MYFPQHVNTTKSRDMMTAFGGYNEKLSCADGEWSEMKNMTSDYYPMLSPRGKRGYTTHYGNRVTMDVVNGGGIYPVSLYERGGLSVMTANDDIAASSYTNLLDKSSYTYANDGSVFAMNGPMLEDEYCEIGKRYDIVKMGARDVIIGANIAYNRETKQKEYLKDTDSFTINEIMPSAENKKLYIDYETNSTVEEVNASIAGGNGGEGDYDGQIGRFGESFGKWNEKLDKWFEYSTLYMYIDFGWVGDHTGETIDKYLGSEIKVIVDNTGDLIPNCAEYFPADEGDGKRSISTSFNPVYTETSGQCCGIIIKLNSHISSVIDIGNEKGEILTLEFPRKELLYGTEYNNRIWACSTDGHEIYASALGEWNAMARYTGISTDSYAVTIGSDGEFTGAVTYNGNPIFFKEKSMIKIAVSATGAHQVKEIPCPGVQKGSRYSLCVINNILYYKGVEGIYAYDGSMPVLVSPNLTKRYFGAEAGALLDKYYISMADSVGTYHMFVYDTTKGLWMREDNTHAISFCCAEDDLFFIELPQKEIRSVRGTVLPDGTGNPYVYEAYGKDSNDWNVTSGFVGFATPDHKYIGKLSIRLSLELGANVDFYIEYDSNGVWEHKFNIAGRGTRSYTIPVIPHRCDHFRYRFVGKGDCKIFSISKTLEEGSDV